MVSRLTVKGQVTIPKPLRESLGLEPGQELEFEESEGALIVRRRAPVDPRRGLVGLLVLVAAHARSRAQALLTRDRGFYRRCFAALRIVTPELPA